MRITYLHQYFNTPDMSGGTRSYEMARRLVAMGHEVNMVTSWREPDDRQTWFETEEAGIKVHWLPVPYSNKMSYPERIRAFFRFAIGAARKAASLPTDVVFVTSTPLTIALPGVYAARKQGVPMVFEVRDLWPQVPIALNAIRNPILKWSASALERWAYSNSDAVVALAPGMKAGVINHGFPESRVAVIPNGADDTASVGTKVDCRRELIKAHPWLQSCQLLVYAGTFGLVNDLEFMVNMASEVKSLNQSMRLVAIGNGAYWQEIELLAERKGVLNDNFFMIDSLPKKEVLKWLSASDAILVLYKGPKIVWEDCVSNKLFDAMSLGKPIISNISGWGPLIAKSVGAGLVLDGQNFSESIMLLNEKLSDSDWLQRAEDASARLAYQIFSRDLQANQLGNLLQAVVDGYPTKAGEITPNISAQGTSISTDLIENGYKIPGVSGSSNSQ